ncbi:tonoplast dicarboxylate transporter [Striga asiatica]|uniref:Tonoplast dicarboxylate transporter n=1 Tax=Striga asiatica TaxID=4170 RepID=A0A5A7QRQ4_STRAF|nr:tonoplast dicarboxylate transporter [Striga asiatica]
MNGIKNKRVIELRFWKGDEFALDGEQPCAQLTVRRPATKSSLTGEKESQLLGTIFYEKMIWAIYGGGGATAVDWGWRRIWGRETDWAIWGRETDGRFGQGRWRAEEQRLGV